MNNKTFFPGPSGTAVLYRLVMEDSGGLRPGPCSSQLSTRAPLLKMRRWATGAQAATLHRGEDKGVFGQRSLTFCCWSLEVLLDIESFNNPQHDIRNDREGGPSYLQIPLWGKAQSLQYLRCIAQSLVTEEAGATVWVTSKRKGVFIDADWRLIQQTLS